MTATSSEEEKLCTLGGVSNAQNDIENPSSMVWLRLLAKANDTIYWVDFFILYLSSLID